MTMPTALAPTVALAEPRVKRFAEKLAQSLGAEIHTFYSAEPCARDVFCYDGGKKTEWLVASWGVELKGNHFAPFGLPTSKAIDMELEKCRVGKDGSMITRLWLSARVLR